LANTLLIATSSQVTAQDDVVIYNHANRPKEDGRIKKIRATLLGYDPNIGRAIIAPYLIFRFAGESELRRVYLTQGALLNGAPFACAGASGAFQGRLQICPRLPADVATKLPATVEMTSWSESSLFWVRSSVRTPLLLSTEKSLCAKTKGRAVSAWLVRP